MRKSSIFALVACMVFLAAPHVFGQKHKVELVKVVTASEGSKIRGPRSIKPTYVNRIRYRVAVKTKATFSAGPSLALPFIPQIPGGASEGGANALTTSDLQTALDAARKSNKPEDEFLQIRQALRNLLERRADEIQSPISTLLADTKEARDGTEDFVRDSDAQLAGVQGPQVVLGRLPALILLIQNASGSWPDAAINGFLADVDIWEAELERISDLQWLADNKERVDAVKARFKELRESVAALSHNGKPDSPAAKFDEAQRVLKQWKAIFQDANTQGVSYFELPYVDVGCGFAFDQNKETVVTLVKQDRLATGNEVTDQELVTVVCSSPLSISGGFGFSTVNEREFVFVPSVKTVTENGQQVQKVINRFGFKNNSSFRPIPLLLLNTRVYERNDTFALHLSAGAGVDIKTGEAGSDVEFIVGPSISFKRSMFVTAGVHIGRVPKLAGGFKLDEEVPTGIDQPPIEKAWKNGFIVAFTYKIR